VEEEKLIIDVETEEERRIDQFLADQMEYSRSFIQKLIKNERECHHEGEISRFFS